MTESASLNAFAELLSRITYKPNIRLELTDNTLMLAGPMLVVSSKVPNAYNPDEMIGVGFNTQIPEYLLAVNDAKQMTKWIFARIMEWERHEAQEWFKVDGRVFDNPHTDV